MFVFTEFRFIMTQGSAYFCFIPSYKNTTESSSNISCQCSHNLVKTRYIVPFPSMVDPYYCVTITLVPFPSMVDPYYCVTTTLANIRRHTNSCCNGSPGSPLSSQSLPSCSTSLQRGVSTLKTVVDAVTHHHHMSVSVSQP